MANSSLVTYVWKGPKTNCNARDHVIDTITIHHIAGNGTLEGCFKTLAYKADPGSVNYGIDSLGAIGVMIDENLRAWTTCDRPNDMRAVTIEVANDKPSDAGGWHVSDKALAALINLCVDICKRNGKTKMIWCGSLAATNARSFASNEMRMTIHKWFAPTGCPGPYLESKMGYIASEVTKRLGGSSPSPAPTPAKKSIDEIAKEVIKGNWGVYPERKIRLEAAGYDYNAVQAKVDELIGKNKPKPTPKKSVDAIAKEVIAGKWGVYPERKTKLEAAGYNYNEVQKRVDELIAGNKNSPKKSVDEVAKEVIRGDWGVDPDRSKKLKAAGYDAKAVQAKVNQLLGL